MSVYPTFDQAAPKLHVGFQSHQHALTVCKTHDFNNAVDILLPIEDAQLFTSIKHTIEGDYFYKATLPLSFFLEEATLKNYVRQGGFTALRCNAKIDTDDVFALLPTGVLVLNVTKDTYESLGLVGSHSQCGTEKGQRFDVRIDLSDPDFKKSRQFDRVKWCFSHTLAQPFEFYVSFVDAKTGKSQGVEFPSKANTKHFPMQVQETNMENILIPSLPSHPTSTDIPGPVRDIWRADMLDTLEWFGMVANEATRINSNDNVDPFYSVYACPEPNSPGSLTRTSVGGFIHPSQISSIIATAIEQVDNGVVPWAAVMVWGFRDAPVSWRGMEHGCLLGGENDYLLVFKPDNQCMLFQAVASHDRFSI
ncbi:ribonuclease P 40kDa subunit-domain-containing protein [Powellomyces hirtus]|nr:ribonuclease P 40kDa subunit-domain-containing protein [Powellomyces hirtus]